MRHRYIFIPHRHSESLNWSGDLARSPASFSLSRQPHFASNRRFCSCCSELNVVENDFLFNFHVFCYLLRISFVTSLEQVVSPRKLFQGSWWILRWAKFTDVRARICRRVWTRYGICRSCTMKEFRLTDWCARLSFIDNQCTSGECCVDTDGSQSCEPLARVGERCCK